MKPPLNPYSVLVVAILLPGMGQVLNRQPVRGLIFVCFAVLLGAFTVKTAAADISFVGKISGGLFVWAMATLDAYKTARIRREVWAHQVRASAASASASLAPGKNPPKSAE
jgi:urea transporter